ncbi:MAG TPA: cytochrome c [Sedimenticola sp.]|nr:cytochrome c [Sedimenticola sp.]
MKRALLFFIMLPWLPADAGEPGPGMKRWYTPEQVAQGKALFARHCSECHGKNAASTPEWRKPGPDGHFPPPPLNGTAHTWHHPLPLLRRTIREGGIRLGGKMPGFQEKLSAAQIDAVIAWFQSLWPDNIYALWSGMRSPTASQPAFIKERNPGKR